MFNSIPKIKDAKEIRFIQEPAPVFGSTVGTELDDTEENDVVTPEYEVGPELDGTGAVIGLLPDPVVGSSSDPFFVSAVS